MCTTARYSLPGRDAQADFDRLVEALEGERGPATENEFVLLDTFDGRLARDGGIALLRRDDDGVWLDWLEPDLAASRGAVALEADPRFAWDLPAGPVRSRLEAVLGVRALLPLARVHVHRREARVRDRRGKTVLVVQLDEPRVRSARRRRASPLPPQLHVVEILGYASTARRARRWTEKALGRRPEARPWALELLLAVGQQAGVDPSCMTIDLEPDLPARVAFRRAISHLLGTLRVNEPGVKADLDSEFLHDYRIAIRRIRALLAAGRDVLPPAVRAHFRAEFRWLNQLTGQIRDLDVQLLGFRDLERRLPPEERPALEALHRHLQSEQRRRQAELAATLESSRSRQMLQDLERALDTLETIGGESADAGLRIQEVATARVRREQKRVRRIVRAIGPRSSDEDLHTLRKRVKRLRTLLECFSPAFGHDGASRVGKRLKSLQKRLGEHHDVSVLMSTLRSSAHALAKTAPPDTLVAAGFLIESLLAEQRAARLRLLEELGDLRRADLRIVARGAPAAAEAKNS